MTETRRGFFQKVFGAVLAGLALPTVARAVNPELGISRRFISHFDPAEERIYSSSDVTVDISKWTPRDEAVLKASRQRFADAIDAEGLQRYREPVGLKFHKDAFVMAWDEAPSEWAPWPGGPTGTRYLVENGRLWIHYPPPPDFPFNVISTRDRDHG